MTPLAENLPLRDIHLPDPVSWWPPAPGWWGLAGLILPMLLALVWLRVARRRSRLKRGGLAMLSRLAEQYRRNGDEQELVRELSVLLRRVALSVYPRRRVAALTGPEWLAFLDQSLSPGGRPKAFSEGVGRALIDAPYNPACQVDAKALIGLVRKWIIRNAGDWRG